MYIFVSMKGNYYNTFITPDAWERGSQAFKAEAVANAIAESGVYTVDYDCELVGTSTRFEAILTDHYTGQQRTVAVFNKALSKKDEQELEINVLASYTEHSLVMLDATPYNLE